MLLQQGLKIVKLQRKLRFEFSKTLHFRTQNIFKCIKGDSDIGDSILVAFTMKKQSLTFKLVANTLNVHLSYFLGPIKRVT